MKTESEIKAIVTATVTEFAADANKQIIDCEVKEGCVMELEGPEVFETLASYRGQNLRSLGNGRNWNLDGRSAAIEIAVERVFESCNEDEEYEDAVAAVEKALCS